MASHLCSKSSKGSVLGFDLASKGRGSRVLYRRAEEPAHGDFPKVDLSPSLKFDLGIPLTQNEERKRQEKKADNQKADELLGEFFERFDERTDPNKKIDRTVDKILGGIEQKDKESLTQARVAIEHAGQKSGDETNSLLKRLKAQVESQKPRQFGPSTEGLRAEPLVFNDSEPELDFDTYQKGLVDEPVDEEDLASVANATPEAAPVTAQPVEQPDVVPVAQPLKKKGFFASLGKKIGGWLGFGALAAGTYGVFSQESKPDERPVAGQAAKAPRFDGASPVVEHVDNGFGAVSSSNTEPKVVVDLSAYPTVQEPTRLAAKAKASERPSFRQDSPQSQKGNSVVDRIVDPYPDTVLDKIENPYGEVAPNFVREPDRDKKSIIDQIQNPYETNYLSGQMDNFDAKKIARSNVHRTREGRVIYHDSSDRALYSQNKDGSLVRFDYDFEGKITSVSVKSKGNDIVTKGVNPKNGSVEGGFFQEALNDAQNTLIADIYRL